VSQVLIRFAEAEQIGRGIATAAIRPMAAAAPRGSVVVVNPSPHDRTDVVELDLAVPASWGAVDLELDDGRRIPGQLVHQPEPILRTLNLTGAQVVELFPRRLHGRELFGRSLDGHRVDRDVVPPRLTLHMDDPAPSDDFDVDSILDAVASATKGDPDEVWEVVVVAGERRRLAAAIPVPALGAGVVRPIEAADRPADPEGVRLGERSIANGLIAVSVAADGTLEIDGRGMRLVGVGRLVDGGDFGDTYNYAPPSRDRVVDRPTAVTTNQLEHGPVRGRLAIVARYDWPVGLLPDGTGRSERTAPVEVTTTLELRAGEPFVRVTVDFTNPSRDHRVRWHLPLPELTDHSSAEGQFAVVDRGLTEEAGHGEVPTPTFPAHGFVHAAGVSVLLGHATEYELVGGRELALTVLRSTGLISRNDNPFREDPAGPEVAVPGAQLLGPWQFSFALLPHAGSWESAHVLAASEAYHLPFLMADGTGAADAETGHPGRGLRVDGEGVVLSALRRRDDWLEIRLVAEHAAPTTALISAPEPFVAARNVNLLGRAGIVLPVEPDGSIRLRLGPWEIVTVQIQTGEAFG
jgi:alpha-mannosidase